MPSFVVVVVLAPHSLPFVLVELVSRPSCCRCGIAMVATMLIVALEFVKNDDELVLLECRRHDAVHS